MKSNEEFELRLNFLTAFERIENRNDFFTSEYLQCVLQMLVLAKHHLFEEDLLKKYEGKSLEEILHGNSCLIPSNALWSNPHQNGKECPVYYNTIMPLPIIPGNVFYDRFFAYFIKHTDLLEIDPLLEYQLSAHHQNNLRLFARFLNLTIRKYRDEIIPIETVLTVQEWITAKEQQQLKEEQEGLQDKDRINGKVRIRRRPNDSETILNQPQTVLLIHYLQKKGITLNSKYLTDADAGKAFELLTGYSQHTIRQDLGQYRNFQNKENLRKVQLVLSNITMLIESQLNEKVILP